jgi:hypothetical protein
MRGLPILQLSCRLFGKASHHPGLLAPLQPTFGSLQLLAFPKAKIAVEMVEIFKCDRKTVHKISPRRLTADCPAPRESVHGCTVRSLLTGCQVTSTQRDRFSRYSKSPDTFRTALLYFLLLIPVAARSKE